MLECTQCHKTIKLLQRYLVDEKTGSILCDDKCFSDWYEGHLEDFKQEYTDDNLYEQELE